MNDSREFATIRDGDEPRMFGFPADELLQMEPDAALNLICMHAVDSDASDVFIHSHEASAEISMRRMGSVVLLAMIPKDQGKQLINYLKVMAGMDISEHRRPMDGRWIHEIEGRRLDMRVNSIATLFGEDLTIRVWDRDVGLRKYTELGILQSDLPKLTNMLNSPSGLILVTGPTGTGKTTTLYSCLQYLNDGTRKICTLEDPVEYALDGIRQAQIQMKIGLDFPELLRNVLRQSPDVIMIGEIRDIATADTAIRAANSGHLVLATLHAPVASQAVNAMLALGANPYFLSSCLLGVAAQRLVRKLCPNCRMAFDVTAAPQTFADIRPMLAPGEGDAIYGPSGCEECGGDGYRGRTGLFEIMTFNRSIRSLIASAATGEEIGKAAIEAGMIEFRRSAMLMVARGATSMEEILRDVPAEHLGLVD